MKFIIDLGNANEWWIEKVYHKLRDMGLSVRREE